MIKLAPYPEIPAPLLSKKINSIYNDFATKINTLKKIKSVDFEPLWRDLTIKKALWQHHQGKCCFCERKRDLKREPDIDHYRPKAGVSEDEKHPGYWWLAYNWDNYLLTCKCCNEDYKRNQFPLLPTGKRAYKPEDNLDDEKPILIHPVKDDPEKFISFEWEGSGDLLVKAIGRDIEGRGQITIDKLTGINDPKVIEERGYLLSLLKVIAVVMTDARKKDNQNIIIEYSETIRKETAPDKPFTGFRRAFFKKWGLGEFVYS